MDININNTFTNASWTLYAGSLVVVWLGYHICVALYNISPFHPLAKFPGPKIAALSYAYEGYYDWWLLGRYGRVIQDMHKKYGPIIRINPDELHCNDPFFADEIYAGAGRIRDKWQHQINTGGAGPVSVTGFSTVPHELHRSRKQALSKYFSKQQMLKLEDEVRDFCQMTINKMLRLSSSSSAAAAAAGGSQDKDKNKKPFDVKEAFNCFTADVISQYAFGEPMGFLAQDGWEPNFATWVKSFFQSAYMMRHNSLARKLAQVLPMLADYMGEDIKAVMRQMNHVIPGYVSAAISNPDDDDNNGRVFADLMANKSIPASEKSMYRLSGEGFNFLLAGTETTAATLTVITYHLLARPEIYARLMKDLQQEESSESSSPQAVDPENLKWVQLERRPYLWAIVQESLRMMPGVSHRSARIARTEDLVYTTTTSRDGDGGSSCCFVVPRGTPIGMTSMINHWDERLFPDPDEFRPERWLLPDGTPDYKLSKMLIAFGKGSRSCIGMDLAYCEVYLMTAMMAFQIIPRAKLYDTTIEDLTYDHDLIVLQTKKGSISVKIEID